MVDFYLGNVDSRTGTVRYMAAGGKVKAALVLETKSLKVVGLS